MHNAPIHTVATGSADQVDVTTLLQLVSEKGWK
jgi:hypothetical protein